LQVIQLNIEESRRRQIAKELKINLSTQCQYIVVFYQCFYFNGAISIVLEYMDGGSLSDFLKTVKTIPEDYLAAICKQASDMWQKLHIIVNTSRSTRCKSNGKTHFLQGKMLLVAFASSIGRR